jgi:hypothetical protein
MQGAGFSLLIPLVLILAIIGGVVLVLLLRRG